MHSPTTVWIYGYTFLFLYKCLTDGEGRNGNLDRQTDRQTDRQIKRRSHSLGYQKQLGKRQSGRGKNGTRTFIFLKYIMDIWY